MEVREPSAKYGAMEPSAQAAIGPLPSDWSIKSIGELDPYITSGSRGWARFYAEAGSGSPFIRITNLSRTRIYPDLQDLRFVRLIPGDPEATRTQLAEGDVLISITADIGIVGHVCATLPSPAYINQHIALVRFDRVKANPKFLAYYLASDGPQKNFRALTDAGAKAGMNLATVRALKIAVPPTVVEQNRIADALSGADALIESLDQLLAKQHQIKQGAMQELLTGQRRLQGFCESWPSRVLRDLGSFLKGRGITRDQALSGHIHCVRYGEIYTAHHDCIRVFHSWISAEVAASATLLKKGDLLFAGSGETKAEIGKCVAFVDDFPAYAGGDIVILRPRGMDSIFLGYALNSPAVSQQKASRGQGDAVVHISATALADIALPIPPLAEQTAIATTLSDMDAEITALEARLAKARALKQGMAQALLTGRIRLV